MQAKTKASVRVFLTIMGVFLGFFLFPLAVTVTLAFELGALGGASVAALIALLCVFVAYLVGVAAVTAFLDPTLLERLRSPATAQAKPIEGDKIQVFLSHSYDDQELAHELVELLVETLGLEYRDIFCSSHPKCDRGFGKSVAELITSNIRDSSVLIALISRRSLYSDFVQFEMGASWVLVWSGYEHCLIPILCQGLDIESLPRPIRGRKVVTLANEDQLRNMIREVGQYTRGRSPDDSVFESSKVSDRLSKLSRASAG
ncbi:MAG: toll/interleukin-1 receptor domain-containing protein [Planctomycetota bacterium]